MHTKKTSLAMLLITSVCALALWTVFQPPRLEAQVAPTTTGTLNTALLAGATTYTINSTPEAVRKDRGLGILYSLTPAAVTNAVTLNIQVSNDKTNWAWATPFTVSRDLTSVGTNYIGFVNIDKATFNNVTWWRLATITAANTNAITNSISWSIH